jgi:uncharacterized protein YeaO (DUF488 family)
MTEEIKFFTSYYANIPNLDGYFLVSISGGITPEIEKVIDKHDKRLAPNLSLFTEYKKSQEIMDVSASFNEERYVGRFKKEVLSNIEINSFIEEYKNIYAEHKKDIVLLCYEKPEDFCHRHIVQEFLNENGYKTSELITEEYEFDYYKYTLKNKILEDEW